MSQHRKGTAICWCDGAVWILLPAYDSWQQEELESASWKFPGFAKELTTALEGISRDCERNYSSFTCAELRK